MKNLIMFFLAVAIFCVPTFSSASVPSNDVSMKESSNDEVDQYQEAMDEFFEMSRPSFKNVTSANDLYCRIFKKLNELKKLADFLDIEEEGILVPFEEIPEEVRQDLKILAKLQKTVCIDMELIYSNEHFGYFVTSEALRKMSDKDWDEICKLYRLNQSKSDFMAKAKKTLYYRFTLAR